VDRRPEWAQTRTTPAPAHSTRLVHPALLRRPTSPTSGLRTRFALSAPWYAPGSASVPPARPSCRSEAIPRWFRPSGTVLRGSATVSSGTVSRGGATVPAKRNHAGRWCGRSGQAEPSAWCDGSACFERSRIGRAGGRRWRGFDAGSRTRCRRRVASALPPPGRERAVRPRSWPRFTGSAPPRSRR
jgi:hypothetical protein